MRTSSFMPAFVVLFAAAAQAAPVYLTQDRSVEARIIEESRAEAPDFGVFDETVTQEHEETAPSGPVRSDARATQRSELGADGILLSGELFTAAGSGAPQGGQVAFAESTLDVAFRLDAPHRFDLDLLVTIPESSGQSIQGVEVSLVGEGFSFVSDRESNRDFGVYTFDEGGVLAAGEYRFLFAFDQNDFEGGKESTFAGALRLTAEDGNVIPLPPAAWAGLMTLGGTWVCGKMRTRRSR